MSRKLREYAKTKPAQVAEYIRKVPGAESQPMGLPSIEEEMDEYEREQEGEKWPWGPKVPIGYRVKNKVRGA